MGPQEGLAEEAEEATRTTFTYGRTIGLFCHRSNVTSTFPFVLDSRNNLSARLTSNHEACRLFCRFCRNQLLLWMHPLFPPPGLGWSGIRRKA